MSTPDGFNASRAPSAIRVVDFSEFVAGPYCSKLLADFGADVIKVERPGSGDRGRSAGPVVRLPDGETGRDNQRERSAIFAYLNTNKRSIVLDLRQHDDCDTAKKLVSQADIVVETFRSGTLDRLGLSRRALQELNERLIIVSITGFGHHGNRAEYAASDLIAWAASGALFTGGAPGREPLRTGSNLTYYAAGTLAAVGALAALWGVRGGGPGQTVEVSLVDGAVQLVGHYLLNAAAQTRTIPARGRPTAGIPMACRDGFLGVNFFPGSPHQWIAFCEMVGRPDLLTDPRFAAPADRSTHWHELESEVSGWLSQHTTDELFQQALAWHLPFGIVASADKLLEFEQFRARSFFRAVPHPIVGTIIMPGPPAIFSGGGWKLRRPAPRLGEHTQEIIREWLTEETRPPAAHSDLPPRHSLPLSGIRVLDLTHGLAGPHATKLLGDIGADVLKVESIQHADTARMEGTILPGEPRTQFERSANFLWVNLNKRDITLNLASEDGMRILKRLVRDADVVASNFRPGVMEAFGLTYDVLRSLNPSVVYLQISGYGSTGPWRMLPCFSAPAEQMAGVSYISGYPKERPITRTVWEDSAVAMIGAFSVIASLHDRARSGVGTHIDLSMAEVIASFNAEAILDFTANSRVWERVGNRHRFGQAAPHGCYRCMGEEAWIAVAVTDEAQWESFCRILGAEHWLQDERFADVASRDEHYALLARMIEERTSTCDRWELASRLQAAGVPAHAVANALEVVEQTNEQGGAGLVTVERAHVGLQQYVGSAFRLSRTPLGQPRPAPVLGEHNHEVLVSLGLTDTEIDRLEQERVTGTSPLNM